MTFLKKPPRYQAYLITMRQERSQGSDNVGEWRFCLEDPHTGERRGFANLEKLVAALEQEMANAETADLKR